MFYFNNVKGIRCHDAKDFLLYLILFFLWKGRARLGVLNLKYTNHVKLFNKMTDSDTTMYFFIQTLELFIAFRTSFYLRMAFSGVNL